MDRRRRMWLILILLAGMGTVFFGRWLFADAACQRLQFALLYSSTTLTVILAALWSIFTRNDSHISQFTKVCIVVAAGLLIPAVLGSFLAQYPGVKIVFCPGCDEAIERAEGLRVAGQIDGAAFLARQSLKECPDPESRCKAGRVLARSLYDKAGVLVQARRCTEVSSILDEAETLAKECDLTFMAAVQERRQYCQLVCSTPAATSTLTRTPALTPASTRTSPPLPVPSPSPLPSYTPILIPTATIELVPCNKATVRISQLIIRDKGTVDAISVVPRVDIPVPKTGTIEVYGAAFMQGRISYEIRYAPIDIANLVKGDWNTIGSRKSAPIGDEFNNALLGRWEESERKNLPSGRYALTVRMFLPDGNYTVERDFERCWTFVVIR
ncbi:MAG: hypothetical protein FJ005_08665 [Chloroflexi bacterium]|nr:hypothetical protein [Chloroflexota bacterium]